MAKTTEKTATQKITLRQKLFEEFKRPLKEIYGDGCVTRTSGGKTGKGYDTTGYQYQFVMNRLNDVTSTLDVRVKIKTETRLAAETKTGNNRYMYEYLSHVWVSLFHGDKEIEERNCYGNHTGLTHGDAIKGAFSNGLKKTAALFGIGADAYEGTIDEDYRPQADLPNGSTTKTVSKPGLPRAWEDDPATKKQVGMIFSLAHNQGYTVETIKEGFKKMFGLESFTKLSKKEASEIIDRSEDAFKKAFITVHPETEKEIETNLATAKELAAERGDVGDGVNDPDTEMDRPEKERLFDEDLENIQEEMEIKTGRRPF